MLSEEEMIPYFMWRLLMNNYIPLLLVNDQSKLGLVR